MNDGFLAEEGLAYAFASDKVNCFTCKKVMTFNKSKAIHTYSSKGVFGRNDHKQFCSWKCAEQQHNKKSDDQKSKSNETNQKEKSTNSTVIVSKNIDTDFELTKELLAMERQEDEARKKAEKDLEKKIFDIQNIQFDNNKDNVVKLITYLLSVYDSNKSQSMRSSALLKVETGILKLTQLGALNEVDFFENKIKKAKQKDLFPMYIAFGGVILFIISLIMGSSSSPKTRDLGLILLLVGIIVASVGFYKYFKKTT